MSTATLTQPQALSPLPQNIELEDINLDDFNRRPSDRSQHNQDQALDEHFADNENANLTGSYPRPDGGKEAWMFLAGCVAVEMMVWGFAFTFGIFQEYYEDHPVFSGDASNVATVGTTQSGIMYISSPVVFALVLRWPQVQRACLFVGLFLLCLSLACSSFATTVSGLIATQGVIFAIGGALIYAPVVVFLDGWFIKRKGIAFGVMWAGSGLAGVIFPLVIGASLERFGHRTTLRALAVFIFVITLPLLHFVKARIPVSVTSPGGKKRFDLGFLWSPTFLLFQAGNVLQGLGYFLPQIYLPTYASELQGNSTLSTLTLVLFNVASVGGCIMMGYSTDRYHVTTCILLSSVPAALSVFLLWGFSGAMSGLSLLYVFCIVYGFFAGAYSSAWPGIIKLVLSKEQAASAEPNLVFGFLALGRGIGNVVSGPLSTALLKHTVGGAAKLGYSSEYAPLIIFTGITALLGGASIFGRLRSGLV